MKDQKTGTFSLSEIIISENGNFAVLFAVTLMVLISVMAFGLDIGFFAKTKSKYQACADTAALSGAERLCYARAEESAKTVVLGSNLLVPEDCLTIKFGFYDCYDEYDNFKIFQDFVQEDDQDFPGDEAVNAVIVIIENKIASLTGFNKEKNIKAAAVAYIPRVGVVAGKELTASSPIHEPMTINNGNIYAKEQIRLNGPVLGENVKLASKNDINFHERIGNGMNFQSTGKELPSDKLPEIEIIRQYILPDPKATLEEYVKKMKKLADVVYTPDDSGTGSFYGMIVDTSYGAYNLDCYFDFSEDHEDHQIIFFDTTGFDSDDGNKINVYITPHACLNLHDRDDWLGATHRCMRQIGITEAKGKAMENTTFIATCPVNIFPNHAKLEQVPLGGPGFDQLNIVSTESISFTMGNNPLRGVNFYCPSLNFVNSTCFGQYLEQEKDYYIRGITSTDEIYLSSSDSDAVRFNFKFGPPFAPMVPVTLGRLIETQITPDE